MLNYIKLMKSLLFAAVCLFLSAHANVIGFDLGSSFFKISLVKPGSPFQIVEILTSKRQTETMMTIAGDMRLFSADAFNAAPKLPQTTFANVASFLAQPYEQETLEKLRADKFILNDFVEDDRGLVAF